MDSSVEYGRRLLPQILDSLAASEPDRILYSLAKSYDISQGFRNVSARAFAKAVDKTAWWLHGQVGSSASIRPVGYIGPHDLRHVLLTYACVKAGCTALFLSPKNSTEGALAVLEATDCNIWVKAHEQPTLPLVKHLLENRPLQLLELPSLDELLSEDAEPYPYTKEFDEAIQDPLCILHTSGSTGHPKPILWTHGLLGTMDAVRLLPPADGDYGLAPWTSIWEDGDTIYSSFPMSHGAGIIMDILMPAYFRLHCILGPVDIVPNIDLLESLAEHGKIDIWSMIPSLVDELGETPKVLEKYKSSKFICASGGPVGPISASKVNETIRVLNLTGTTEGLFIGNLIVDRKDWLYFAFHPYSGFEFKEVQAGIYEHWVHRNEHWLLFQGIFHTFPDQPAVNFKDLYTKHPTKPDLWAYKGRNDDLVVLSTGYKISPLDTEALITTHPAIDGCLVIGSGKPYPGLLIELKDPTTGDDELFDSIWAIVEKANLISRHTSQLRKDYVAFTEPDKPFIRTDKRTVKRRATLDLYGDYIERFYESRSLDEDRHFSILIDSSSSESIMDAVRQMFSSILPAVDNASPDADLFRLGLDSLLVFRAIKIMRTAFKLNDRLSLNHLYTNPTLEKFSVALAKLINQTRENGAINGNVDDDAAKLRKLIDRHRSRQPIKLNAMDQIAPSIYGQMNFFIPLQEGVSFQQAFERLREGLRRTIELIPVLEGKIIPRSEHEYGYKPGEACITIPPLPETQNGANGLDSTDLKQLVYRDVSTILPCYKTLRDAGFLTSAFRDEVINDVDIAPTLPADVFNAQANFIDGGCILVINIHHWCSDGVGTLMILRAWAESCRYVQGDETATCAWLDPESLNRNLPGMLHEEEGLMKPVSEVDPNVWAFVAYPNPDEAANEVGASKAKTASSSDLPTPPAFNRSFPWPPPLDDDTPSVTSSTFLITPENLQKLKEQVVADPGAKGVIKSDSDIVQAFLWKSALKARYRVATELRGETFGTDDMTIIESTVDARPYFSSSLPPTYMGNLVVMNRFSMPVEAIGSPNTTVGSVAYMFREAANRITAPLVHDAFTLLRSVPDYREPRYAGLGLQSMHATIDNLMLFPANAFPFGNDIFAGAGCPDALRLEMDNLNKIVRLLLVLPLREDGGVELLIGTLPDEFDMLMADEEFTKYAKFLG